MKNATNAAKASLAPLGITLVLAGLFTALIISNQTIWSTHDFSECKTLAPLSESLVEMNVNKVGSIIHVQVAPNNTLAMDLIHDGQPEFSWQRTSFKENVMILNSDLWTLKIRNTSTKESCSYNSSIILREPQPSIERPYLWLRAPLIFTGGLLLAAATSIYLIDRFKKHVKKDWAKTAAAISVLALLFFSNPIGGLILGTSNPWMICEGNSMEPAINHGDLAIITGVNPRDLSPSDVIVFQKVNLVGSPDELSTLSMPVAHRIQYLNALNNHFHFKTRGDNNAQADDWAVPEEGISGKVILIIPKVGYALLIFQRIEVKTTVILVIFLVFFVWPLVKQRGKPAVPKRYDDFGEGGSKETHSAPTP